MALGPKPSPVGTEGLKSQYLGPFNLLSLRAFLVGKTILGMRVDDTIKAMDWLSSRGETDPKAITVYGSGAMGAVALHAAVLDSRIKKVVVENTLASYRMVTDPLHRNISEVVIPGVLAKYDMSDLLAALAPRPVTVIHPLDATRRRRVSIDQFQKSFSAAGVKVIDRAASRTRCRWTKDRLLRARLSRTTEPRPEGAVASIQTSRPTPATQATARGIVPAPSGSCPGIRCSGELANWYARRYPSTAWAAFYRIGYGMPRSMRA